MSEFRRRSPLIEEDKKNATKGPKGKSLVEALLGDSENIRSVAERFNLDPDMSEKIVVPLLSLLDKYGVGESLTSSNQVESATQTFEVIRDVAPIVKGAAEYISGKRQQLKKDDLDFLNSIRDSQKVNDTSLFNEGDEEELFSIGESVNNPQPMKTTMNAPIQPLTDFKSFQKNDYDDFWADATGANEANPVIDNDLTKTMERQQQALNNWAYEQSGGTMKREGTGVYTTQSEGVGGVFDLGAGAFSDTFAGNNSNTFGLVDVEVLAKESGLSMNEIMEGDSQSKINGDSFETTNYEIDLDEFKEIDSNNLDYTQYETPKDVEEYNPLHIAGLEVPKFKVDIDEFKDYLPELED